MMVDFCNEKKRCDLFNLDTGKVVTSETMTRKGIEKRNEILRSDRKQLRWIAKSK